MPNDLYRMIRRAFAALEHGEILGLAEELHPAAELPDDIRLALAYALLAAGKDAEAEGQLNATVGDGSATTGDLAFVRAFLKEHRGDLHGMVELLLRHVDDEHAVQRDRIRLRAADGLLRLERYEEVASVLLPLLKPPGGSHTLEAQLIVLEGMLQFGSEKEKIIEQVTLLDLLIERGFRMGEAANVVYYARLMDKHRIEPVIAPLLRSHESLLNVYTAGDEGETLFLLAMGDRHKIPSAVRAAGRSYAAAPFRLEGVDPEAAAYLFASHEEHEAARNVFLTNLNKAAIRRNGNLWGPLLVETYHSGHWREALDMIREHRRELMSGPRSADVGAWQAVCEFHLGRMDEALQRVRNLGPSFYHAVHGVEAACAPVACFRLDRAEDAIAMARVALDALREDSGRLGDFVSGVFNELLIRGMDVNMAAWLDFMAGSLPPEGRWQHLYKFGMVGADWAYPDVADHAAGLTEREGQPGAASVLRALSANLRGNRDAASRYFADAKSQPGNIDPAAFGLLQASALRLHGDLHSARVELDAILARDDCPVRYQALAIKSGILDEAEATRNESEELYRDAIREAARSSPSLESLQTRLYAIRQLRAGLDPEALRTSLRRLLRIEPGSVEVLRIARIISQSPEADEGTCEWAKTIAHDWRARNLDGQTR